MPVARVWREERVRRPLSWWDPRWAYPSAFLSGHTSLMTQEVDDDSLMTLASRWQVLDRLGFRVAGDPLIPSRNYSHCRGRETALSGFTTLCEEQQPRTRAPLVSPLRTKSPVIWDTLPCSFQAA